MLAKCGKSGKKRFFTFSGIKRLSFGKKFSGLKIHFSGEKSFWENKYIFREKRVNFREQKDFALIFGITPNEFWHCAEPKSVDI